MFKRFHKPGMLLLAAAVLLSCSSSKMSLSDMGAKGLQLSYKPKAGFTFKYKMSSNSDATMEIMGQDQGGASSSEAVVRWQVTNASDNTVSYNLSYESVNLQLGEPGSPDPKPFESKLLQSNVTIKTDQFGNVLTIGGTDELKKMTLGANIDIELKELFLTFPQKPLKIGDSWPKDDTETVIGGPLKIEVNSNTTYSFAGVEKYQGIECYKFGFQTKSSLSGAGEQGGMDLEYEGSGTSSGDIYFDYLNGLIVARSSSTTIEGVISMPSQGMDIPRTDVQNTKIELIK